MRVYVYDQTMASLRTLVIAGCVLAACGRPAVVPTPATRVESSADGASGIVGAWLGYGDGLAFASDSDRVQLVITALGPGGQITGTIAFGEPGTAAAVDESDMADSEGDDGGSRDPSSGSRTRWRVATTRGWRERTEVCRGSASPGGGR